MSEIKQIFFRLLILLFCLESSLSQKCGFSDNSTRIVGGKDAGPLKWPWMAFLEVKFEESDDTYIYADATRRCGGALVNDEWVLTAAHCFDLPEPAFKLIRVEVTLGEYDITQSEGTEVKTNSSENIIHESYDKETVVNDIALIKLKTKLDFKGKHKYLQPICLPQKGIPIDKNRCYATGWGDTTGKGEGAHILQELKLPIIDNKKFKVHRTFKSDKQLCAGGESGRDTCEGDSGGPLQCQLANNVWVQEGITSYGAECADGNPAVYTKVSAYLPWIKSNTRIK